MAEVLALTTAAAQFIDVGSRVLIKLSRLCSDLQNAPKAVETARSNLSVLVRLVERIKQDLEAARSGPASTLQGAVPPERLAPATTSLDECLSKADKLSRTLDNLVPKCSDNVAKRVWRAIVTVKKEKEILGSLMCLEQLKSNLGLWYQLETLSLVNDQLLTNQKMLDVVQGVDGKISPVGGELGSLGNDVRCSNTAVQKIFEKTETRITVLDQGVSQLHGMMGGISDQLHSTHRSVQDLTSEAHIRDAAISRVDSRLESLCHDQKERDFTVQYEQAVDRLADQIALRFGWQPSSIRDLELETDTHRSSMSQTLVQQKVSRRPQQGSCTCGSSKSSSRILWPPIEFYHERGEHHHPVCDLYWRTDKSWTIGVRAVLPRLLAKSISLAFTATSGSGGFSISPALQAVRCVDKRQSPAFRAIALLKKSMYDGHFPTYPESSSQLRIELRNLYTELATLFEAGNASGFDQDKSGYTLLHELVELADHLGAMQPLVADEITQVIALLTRFGADVNAISTAMNWITFRRCGTALDQILDRRIPSTGLELEKHRPFVILDILLRYEATATYPSSYNVLEHESWFLFRVLASRPDFAAEYGCSELSVSVIRRCTSELDRLLSSGHDVNGNQTEPFQPLVYALGWRPGMNRLLKAGAEALPAACMAIRLHLVAEVKLLLRFNCPLFYRSRPRPNASLLQETSESHSDDNIIRPILNALATRRHQLMDLAKERLPSKKLDFLPLQTRRGQTLLDKDASLVFSLLETAGVTVPSELWPGRDASIYHHHPRLTTDAAIKLYDLGFRSTDVEDSFGITPALILCCELKLECLLWFLDHGARTSGFPPPLPPSLPHTLALAIVHDQGSVDIVWGILRFHRSLCSYKNVSARLKRIGAACSLIHADTCDCVCSSYGCSPVLFLFKGRSCSWRWRIALVNLWLDLTDASSCLLEVSYMEICRLEIFERLGMAHICCQYERAYEPKYREAWVMCQKDPEEEKELYEEDRHFKAILDAYMQLYKDLRKEHSGPFTLFWDAWWEVLDDFLPEREWKMGILIPAEAKMPRHESDSGEPISSEASYGLDGQIRGKVRSRLGYRDDEDSADIFADAMACLFHDGGVL